MKFIKESEVIRKEIDMCRRELNSLVSTSNLPTDKVLSVSQKLDILILDYYTYQKYETL